MSEKTIVIQFADRIIWQESREAIDNILTEFTGKRSDDYPQTKSLPPLIVGIEINDEGIAKLRELDGVTVRVDGEE